MSYNESFFESILSVLGKEFRAVFEKISAEEKMEIQEIRLRSNRPIALSVKGNTYFLALTGKLNNKIYKNEFISSSEMIKRVFQNICSYSIYSHQEEIKRGFITIRGGHRIGICGSAVLSKGDITSIKDISSVNIRIARQKEGVSKSLFGTLSLGDEGVLIVGPPSSGKTTVLRDIAKSLSIGKYSPIKKVALVDERGELACMYNGEMLNDVGFCDVLDGYPKGEGILQAIRVLSPEVIICDEIGSVDDAMAVEEGLNAGVSIISTMHAKSIDELLNRKQALRLLKTGAFSKVVMLKDKKRPSQIEKIYGVDELLAKNNRINNISIGRNVGGILGVS